MQFAIIYRLDAENELRVNISNALTLGLPEELDLVGYQTNVALTIFFVPYIVFEIPSNILLKRFKPNVWCMSPLYSRYSLLTVTLVPTCMLVFGATMLAQGFGKYSPALPDSLLMSSMYSQELQRLAGHSILSWLRRGWSLSW